MGESGFIYLRGCVKDRMKTRYRLIRRGVRSGGFYCVDTNTGKRTSLGTGNEDDARQIIEAKNQAERQPALNLQIAKAYLAGTDSGITTRTWQHVFEAVIAGKQDANQLRWQTAAKDKAFDLIRDLVVIETQVEKLLKVMQQGTVSTNLYLRRLHNFALDMSWLPWPIVPKRQWPPVRYKEKRAVTLEEHEKIVARERNPATWAFYQLLWHLGGSQTDIATLTAKDIDWDERTISYSRRKTGVSAIISFGDEVAEILRTLPSSGELFPALARIHERHRAKLFLKRLATVGIKGISLHSYRYAWAERAKTAGYPERFAMQALGHNSKAVHRAYSKKAQMRLPSLEEYERERENKVVSLAKASGGVSAGEPQAVSA